MSLFVKTLKRRFLRLLRIARVSRGKSGALKFASNRRKDAAVGKRNSVPPYFARTVSSLYFARTKDKFGGKSRKSKM